MQLTETDAAAIDRFIQEELDSSLLQSWMWGEFQAAVGRKIERRGVKREGRLVASAFLVKHELPFGVSYIYVPRGPVVVGQGEGKPDQKILTELHKEIVDVAREWKAAFVRIDPPVKPELQSLYRGLGYRPAANQIQPRVTARLDLKRDREEILAAMKSKTRYNVRLSVRKGVTVRESVDPADIEMFVKLNQETTERNRFTAHEDSYYLTQFEMLGRAGLLKLFVAEFRAEPLAVIAVAMHGRTATYLHGVSSSRERNRMPTFIVHWEAIKTMQRVGLHWYDFHGVAPTDDPNHAWAGITRFKLGFGAKRIEFMGALDLPLRRLTCAAYALRLKVRKSDGR